jgi:hypothetical protein
MSSFAAPDRERLLTASQLGQVIVELAGEASMT